jgi:penicillin-binding protein A
MNRPIVRLYGLVVVLFALLIGFTSRWTVFEASSLRANSFNKRGLLQQQRIARGEILASNGSVLARSVRGAEGTYTRTYPTGSLFTPAVGYSFIEQGQVGLERYRSAALNGQTDTSVQSILDQLQGRKPRGNTVMTTLVPSAQRTATDALGEHEGAVVALDPRTGSVEVMASTPSYNANAAASPNAFQRITREPGSPLVNRALQYGYAPGSTFKVVTATAAIDTGQFTPQSTVDGRNNVTISGLPLKNDNNESLGQVTLTQALAKSVNTVYAQIAVQLGKQTLARYMRRFGFDRKPQLDYPAAEMSSSGEYLRNGRLISPTSAYVDVGRMGIGQDKLKVTPLQMAEVAAAVANRGTLMVPHLSSSIVEPDGHVVQRITPKAQSVVMKSSTAAALTKMMEAVVNEGTGTSAQIPGVQVAGKTGTAETQIGTAINNVWFIAFAPAQDPTVAVAVTLKGVPGQGAAFAAPVAKQVMEVLLHG